MISNTNNCLLSLIFFAIFIWGTGLTRASADEAPFFNGHSGIQGSTVPAPSGSVPQADQVAPEPRQKLSGPSSEHSQAQQRTGLWGALGRIILCLALVIGLFLGFSWITKKVSPSSRTALPPEVVSVLGQTTLTQRHRLYLVRLGSKLVLLTVSPEQVESVAELTDPGETATILARLSAMPGRGERT